MLEAALDRYFIHKIIDGTDLPKESTAKMTVPGNSSPMKCLLLFSMEVGLVVFFGTNESQRDEVIQYLYGEYYGGYDLFGDGIGISAVKERVEPIRVRYFDCLRGSENFRESAGKVGSAFASICDCPTDDRVINFGSQFFIDNVQLTQKLCKSIIDGGTGNKDREGYDLESLVPAEMEDRFTDNRDGTVSDRKTGLTWQKADDGKGRNWTEANQYCEKLVLGGKADWRLPSTDELKTIIDDSRGDPAINPVFNCRSESYWTDTVGHIVDFEYGISCGTDMSSDYIYVRCVRGGPGKKTGR